MAGSQGDVTKYHPHRPHSWMGHSPGLCVLWEHCHSGPAAQTAPHWALSPTQLMGAHHWDTNPQGQLGEMELLQTGVTWNHSFWNSSGREGGRNWAMHTMESHDSALIACCASPAAHLAMGALQPLAKRRCSARTLRQLCPCISVPPSCLLHHTYLFSCAPKLILFHWTSIKCQKKTNLFMPTFWGEQVHTVAWIAEIPTSFPTTEIYRSPQFIG